MATHSEWTTLYQAAFSGGELCFFCIALGAGRRGFRAAASRQASDCRAGARYIAQGRDGGNAILMVLGKFETNSLLSCFPRLGQ
jgi:hypothetical protein